MQTVEFNNTSILNKPGFVYTYDPNDEYIWYEKGWGPLADMDDDLDVDLADFEIFCDPNHWLWQACWRSDYVEYGMMMATGGGV